MVVLMTLKKWICKQVQHRDSFILPAGTSQKKLQAGSLDHMPNQSRLGKSLAGDAQSAKFRRYESIQRHLRSIQLSKVKPTHESEGERLRRKVEEFTKLNLSPPRIATPLPAYSTTPKQIILGESYAATNPVFAESYRRFLMISGTQRRRAPKLGGAFVDMYFFYSLVYKAGGFERAVALAGSFTRVHQALPNYSRTSTSASHLLKKLYKLFQKINGVYLSIS